MTRHPCFSADLRTASSCLRGCFGRPDTGRKVAPFYRAAPTEPPGVTEPRRAACCSAVNLAKRLQSRQPRPVRLRRPRDRRGRRADRARLRRRRVAGGAARPCRPGGRGAVRAQAPSARTCPGSAASTGAVRRRRRSGVARQRPRHSGQPHSSPGWPSIQDSRRVAPPGPPRSAAHSGQRSVTWDRTRARAGGGDQRRSGTHRRFPPAPAATSADRVTHPGRRPAAARRRRRGDGEEPTPACARAGAVAMPEACRGGRTGAHRDEPGRAGTARR